MSRSHFDIVIIGGGPGGLTLAHGLKKAGLDVAVFEKDRARTDYVQGFRLRVRQRGLDALAACLPPAHYEAFLATLGRAPTESILLSEQMEVLDPSGEGRVLPMGQDEDTHLEKSVSRITLRQVLLSGLEGVVRFGKVFARYEVADSGLVTAHFEDGEAITCNILIGADGVSSRVRQQLLPDAKIVDTGVRRLAGKITIPHAEQIGLPRAFFDYNARVVSNSSRGLMIASHIVDPGAYHRYGLIGQDDDTHKDIAGFHFNNTTSYLWWNTAYWQNDLAPDDVLQAMSGAALLDLLSSRISHWHEDIRKLVAHTEPSTVALLRVRTSEPVEPWRTGPVTLLGDAIHSMTYFRALGGNSAIYDAGLLSAALTARRDGKPTLDALQDYEAAMLKHGHEAVRYSLSALQRSLGQRAA